MTPREWMEEEYAAEKRKQQGNSIGKYLGTKTFRVSTKAGYSHSNEPKEAERKEKEE